TVVHTALSAVIDSAVRQGMDLRTHEQRGADAIREICGQWLDRSDRPMIAGERPHVTLTIDIPETVGRPALSEAAKRMSCDASITRLVTKGRSEPLDVGSRTPLVSPSLRRAV